MKQYILFFNSRQQARNSNVKGKIVDMGKDSEAGKRWGVEVSLQRKHSIDNSSYAYSELCLTPKFIQAGRYNLDKHFSENKFIQKFVKRSRKESAKFGQIHELIHGASHV